jgi:hypothetical protein
LNYKQYLNFQNCSKSLYKLPAIPVLHLNSFSQSDKKFEFKLDNASVCDSSFVYIAKIGYVSEFERLINNSKITIDGKQRAFLVIIESTFYYNDLRSDTNEEMIIKLIQDGNINYYSKYPINWKIQPNSIFKPYEDSGNILLWAASRGYGNLINLLLKDFQINVNEKSKLDTNAVQFAAKCGSQNCMRILLSCERIENNEARNGIDWVISCNSYLTVI